MSECLGKFVGTQRCIRQTLYPGMCTNKCLGTFAVIQRCIRPAVSRRIQEQKTLKFSYRFKFSILRLSIYPIFSCAVSSAVSVFIRQKTINRNRVFSKFQHSTYQFIPSAVSSAVSSLKNCVKSCIQSFEGMNDEKNLVYKGGGFEVPVIV